ncbi:far-red elongated hypocotyls 3 [Perilla frutescens var. frutescens]|nr:far-red elongated hypocotyls 3 [Perilla frutescens var. frutescens]
MNVDIIPEQYILRRWTRDCKRRCIPGLKNCSKTPDENISGLVFVNSIMRLSYDMAYEAKGDAGCRSRVHKCLWKLRQQMLKDREMESKRRDKTFGDGKGGSKQYKDPAVVKSRGKTVRRKWRNTKLKGNRGGVKTQEQSLVSLQSNEVEKSFKEPDRYWPYFCQEFNSQKSQLFSETSMDYEQTAHNETMMFFFRGVWTRELESTVLNKLDFEHWNHNWIVGDLENNRRCLRLVRDEVNLELGLEIPYTAYLEKVAEWEDRFHQFKYLISRSGVFYYAHRNSMEASAAVWTKIARTQPGLLVYRPRGEPCWDQMRVLFQDAIVVSKSQTVGNERSVDGSHSQCVSEVVNQSSCGARGKKIKKSPSCSYRSAPRGNSTSDSG